jgi:hypothetical protein
VEVEEGRQENQWEEILEEELGVDADLGWDKAPQTVRNSLIQREKLDFKEGHNLALRQMAVVTRERELADRERKERRHAKLEEKWRVKTEKVETS